MDDASLVGLAELDASGDGVGAGDDGGGSLANDAASVGARTAASGGTPAEAGEEARRRALRGGASEADAAKAAGYKTAFVRRPYEWGKEGLPDPEPNPRHDVIVDDFPSVARALGVDP